MKYKKDNKFISDIQNITSYYENQVRPNWLEYYRLFKGDTSQRRKYIDTRWQTNVAAGIIKKTVLTFYGHIFDNLIQFYVGGASESKKDRESAEFVEYYLLWNYSVSKTKNPLHMQILDALILGEGYGKQGFYRRNRNIKYAINGKIKSKKIEKKHGDYEYVSPFEICIDPGSKDPDNPRYKIRRRLISKNKINSVYKDWFELSKEDLEDIEKNAYYFIEQDWDYKKNVIMGGGDLQSISDANDNYVFDKNKYYEIIEYWEDDDEDGIVKILVNGFTVYDGINPRPIKTDPYNCIYYSREGGTIRGTGLAYLLKDYENMATALLNSYIDEVKLKSNPVLVRVVGPSQLDSVNDMYEMTPGAIIDVDSPGALQPLNFGGANVQVIDLVNFLENAAFMVAGVNEIVMGSPLAGSKVPRVAGDVAQRTQGFKVRMLHLFDSIGDVMSKLGEFRIEAGQMFMEDGDIMKLFDKENKVFKWKEMKKEMLEGQYDVVYDASVLRSAFKEIRIAQLTQFLSVAGNLGVDPTTGIGQIDYRELLHELAKHLDISDRFVLSQKEGEKKIKQGEEAKLKIQSDLQKKAQQMQQQAPGAEQLGGEAKGTAPAAKNPEAEMPKTPEEESGQILKNALSPL